MFSTFIGFAYVISQAMQMSSPAAVQPASNPAAKSTQKVYKPKKPSSKTNGNDADEWLKDTNFKN